MGRGRCRCGDDGSGGREPTSSTILELHCFHPLAKKVAEVERPCTSDGTITYDNLGFNQSPSLPLLFDSGKARVPAVIPEVLLVLSKCEPFRRLTEHRKNVVQCCKYHGLPVVGALEQAIDCNGRG